MGRTDSEGRGRGEGRSQLEGSFPLGPRFDTLWVANPNLRFQVTRYVSSLFLMIGTMYVCSLMSVLADSFYNPNEMKSLPDRLHDQILHRRPVPEWAYALVDIFTSSTVLITHCRFVLFLPAPVNFQVGSRFLNITMFLYLFRAIAIVVTTVPPSKPNCIPPRPSGLYEFLYDALMQAISHNRECSGMIISGHTSVLVGTLCCWSLYGRWGAASRMAGAPLSRFQSWIGLREEEEEEGARGESLTFSSWRNAFIVQLFRFLRQWWTLSRSGVQNARTSAAFQAFRNRPTSRRVDAQRGEVGFFRRALRLALDLPWLRYYCYGVATACICAIPCVYNHYTIDVLLAVTLTILTWSLYHAALAVLLLNAKATNALWHSAAVGEKTPRATEVIPSDQELASASMGKTLDTAESSGASGGESGSPSSFHVVTRVDTSEETATQTQMRSVAPCFYATPPLSDAAQQEFKLLRGDSLFQQPLFRLLGRTLRVIEGL